VRHILNKNYPESLSHQIPPQSNPIKKLILESQDVKTSRPPVKFEEEEKKLPLSDEKPQKHSKNIIQIEENQTKKAEPSTTEVISEFYRVGKILGKGAFGKVNLAIDRETGELVAIKSINKHYLSDSSSKSKLAQEVAILKKINHKNIVCMKDTFETAGHMIFVMEL